MKQNALTLLGCSGSLVFMAITSSPAKAIMPPDYAGAGVSKVDSQTNNSVSQEGSFPAQVKATEAEIKRLSQATFGCTCAVCLGKVHQMLQQGQLSL
ncbi:MAG: hypothetical protein WCA35_19395 [Kovacikia sp.]